MCVLQHSWFISHPLLFLCMWQRGFPVACLGVVSLSPSRAVIGHTVFAWHVLLTSVGLAAALKLEAICCSEVLATGSCARDYTERRHIDSVSVSCYISQTICNRTPVCTPYVGCTVCIGVFALFHSDCALRWAHISVSPVWLVPYCSHIPTKAHAFRGH